MLLNEVLDGIDNGSSNLLHNCSLYNGLSGLIFIIDHLIKEEIIEEHYLDFIKNMIEILVDNCLLLIKNENYDYLNGSIGILYALAILGDEKASMKLLMHYMKFQINNLTTCFIIDIIT